MIENIVTKKEIDLLSKQKKRLKLLEFEDFFGIDGALYFKGGKILASEDYQAVGVMSLAIPANIENEITRRAIENRRIRESNAYICKYELTIDSNFDLKHHNQGVGNNNSHIILSVVYIRADKEKLEKLKKS